LPNFGGIAQLMRGRLDFYLAGSEPDAISDAGNTTICSVIIMAVISRRARPTLRRSLPYLFSFDFVARKNLTVHIGIDLVLHD
jgi:hypothetical protein